MSRIIDCHCHIYPDAIAERAVAGTSGFYGLPSRYNGRISQLYELGTRLGVDHYVVFSVATTPHQTASINEFIARAVAESHGSSTPTVRRWRPISTTCSSWICGGSSSMPIFRPSPPTIPAA